MEAVPRLPMISFELKTSIDQTDFQSKIKEYIKYHYNEDAETFTNQIYQIEGLRATAIRPPKDPAGCASMKRYYCQLHFLTTRFPMGKDGDAAFKVKWKDPYTDLTVSAADITLELASVLYNIGALHSQLGAADARTSADGMKMACSHFQCAAWAFQHILEEFPQMMSYDPCSDLLSFLNHICLAQAQECILEKSMMDNRKASIIMKIAIQTAEYYKQSLKVLTSALTEETSLAAISSKWQKKWEAYVKFKVAYYGCIGFLYQGQQSEELQKMGERVAYYQAAFAKLEESRKLCKDLENIDAVREALQFTQDVVEGKKKAAVNENEFIYHEQVPPINLLPDIKGASLVKGIPFSVSDLEVSGPDIFGRLIPLTAHQTSSIYSEELAKLQRKITSAVLKREEELENFLATLQLEELQAREEWQLPQDLIDRCAAFSAKPDAIPNLIDAMKSLSETFQDVENMLTEIRRLLQKEEEAVLDYEQIIGKRPPSIAATDLTREANKYQDAHAKASESNQTLHKAMELHLANLKLLALPLRDLKNQIPAITLESVEDEAAMKEMQNLMNKVKEMKQQRGMLLGQLREAISRDDITHLVVTYTGDDKEELFKQEIAKHQKQSGLIKQNLVAQDKILGAIQDSYPKYGAARRNVGEKLRRRDAMVSGLKASFDAYEDLLAKSNKGLEFYSKLQSNVSKLLQRVRSTCKVQEEEREQVLANILKDVPRSVVPRHIASETSMVENIPRPNNHKYARPIPDQTNKTDYPDPVAPSGGLKLKDYLNIKKETGKLSLVDSTPSPVYNPAGYPPAPSPHMYDSSVTWVPGIRPAPVGSEETEPSISGQSNFDPSANLYSSSQWRGAKLPFTPPVQQCVTQDNTAMYRYQPHNTSQTTYAQMPYNPNQTSTNDLYNPSAFSNNPSQDMMSQNNQLTSQCTSNIPNPVPSYGLPASTPATSQYTTASAQSALYNFTPDLQRAQFDPSAHQYTPYNPQTSAPQAYYNVSPSIQQGAQFNPELSAPHLIPSSDSVARAAAGSLTQFRYGPSEVSQGTPLNNQYVAPPEPYSTTSYVPQQGQQYLPPQPQDCNLPSNGSGSNASAKVQGVDSTSYHSSGGYNLPSTENVLSYAHSSGYVSNMQIPSTGNAGCGTPMPQIGTLHLATVPTVATSVMSSSPSLKQTSQGSSEVPHVPVNSSVSTNYTTQSTPAIDDGFIVSHVAVDYSRSIAAKHMPGTSTQNERYIPPCYKDPNQSIDNTHNGYTPSAFANQYSVVSPSQITNSSSNFQPGIDISTPIHQDAMQSPVISAAEVYASNIPMNSIQSQQYVPSMNSEYKHASEYLQFGNTSLYTQTSKALDYAITSGNYTSSSKTENLTDTPHTKQSMGFCGEFPPQPYGNAATQSPVTYRQAGNVSKAATNTTSSSIYAMTSPIENPSNLDLLSDLDLNVSQPPLQPEPRSQVIPESPGKAVVTTSIPEVIPKREKTETATKVLDSTKVADDKKIDAEFLKSFVLEVEKFEKFVEGLTLKTLNGPTTLEVKWKEIMEIQEKDNHSKSISVARCYPMKNRFPDILPFDDSRVELPSTKDDYINASYMKPLTGGIVPLILTQAPLPVTYMDFWTMIVERQVEVVVCLLADSEIGEHIYWPVEKGQELQFGVLRISLQSCNTKQHWVERILSISSADMKIARVIVHLQFTSWPGSSFPASPAAFLSFTQEVTTFFQQQRGSYHPAVIHCLSGVGRTGLFCLTLAAMHEIKTGRGIPDIVLLAARMGQSRKNCLRDREHLKFAYQSVLYCAQDLLLKSGILTSGCTSGENKQNKEKCHTRHPSEDYLVTSDTGQLQSKLEPSDKEPDANTEDMGSRVANHYNCVKEVGIEMRKTSRIYYLRNFNNWIKVAFIGKELEYLKEDVENRLKSYRKLCVLDLCSGKGGDIKKWFNGPVSHVIFADIAETSMEHCKARYKELPRRNDVFTAEFITADCTKVRIRERMKDVTKTLDLVSCQFAFHYCFESLPQAEVMLKNASECLRPGGRFIGTIPNAREIVKRLNENDGSFGNEIFNIKSEYKQPYPLFGSKYDFKLEGVVDCPEFLVHFPTFVQLAKRFGLKLLYVKKFPSFFHEAKDSERRLLERIQALEAFPAPGNSQLVGPLCDYSHAEKALSDDCRCVGTLSKPEWEAITLYHLFAFEKVATCSWDHSGNPVFDL